MEKSPPKSVLISGCSSGIGLCVARGLQQRRYRVIASARKTEDVDKLLAAGLEAVRLDLDDSSSIAEAVEQTLALTGNRLYALFNNAGFGQYGAVEDLSREALRAQFETNLFGTHELMSRLLPTMRRQGHGRIIQNSSVLGLVALPYRGAYNASKFALEALTDTLRLELRGSGIFVSLIEPGPIESRFGRNAYDVFKRTIEPGRSRHRAAYADLADRLAREQHTSSRFRLSPESVLKKVIHALESSSPNRRYPVTVPTHVFAALRRLLPSAAMDKLLARQA